MVPFFFFTNPTTQINNPKEEKRGQRRLGGVRGSRSRGTRHAGLLLLLLRLRLLLLLRWCGGAGLASGEPSPSGHLHLHLPLLLLLLLQHLGLLIVVRCWLLGLLLLLGLLRHSLLLLDLLLLCLCGGRVGVGGRRLLRRLLGLLLLVVLLLLRLRLGLRRLLLLLLEVGALLRPLRKLRELLGREVGQLLRRGFRLRRRLLRIAVWRLLGLLGLLLGGELLLLGLLLAHFVDVLLEVDLDLHLRSGLHRVHDLVDVFGAVSPKSVNEPPVFVGRPWSVLPITSLHGLSRLRLLRLLHGGLRAILLRLLL